MASRDTDISTNITSTTGGTPPTTMTFAAMTLEEEALANGWSRIAKPVGGEPLAAPVAGMRGDPDLDSDGTLVPDKPKSKVIDEG